MSKIKKMPAIGWVVVGIAVAVLAVPTVAGATAVLKFTGIEGSPSGDKADVTAANQLLTTTAQPQNLFSGYVGLGAVGVNQTTSDPILTAPSGSGLIVDNISANVYLWDGTAEYDSYVFYVGTANCSKQVMTANEDFAAEYYPNAESYTTETDLAPGVPVPEGDALCMQLATGTHDDSFYVFADATASVVPASSVPSVVTLKKLDPLTILPSSHG
jgi:hypothetical protein